MKEYTRKVAVWCLACLIHGPVWGELKSQVVDYQDGETRLQGYLVWDDSQTGRRPGVLVVHEWWGLNDYARQRARQLAELGYVAFALDMYGAGKVTRHPDQAGSWMKEIRNNNRQWVTRAETGLSVLKRRPEVDPQRLAAIGYCFGGATVLQMAYSGLDLDAVVSFHGSLPVPQESQLKQIQASILVAHGSADPFVPREAATTLINALDRAGVDWELAMFGNTRHGFTNPSAAEYGMEALAYNRQADRRSWAMMRELFDEVLKPGKNPQESRQ